MTWTWEAYVKLLGDVGAVPEALREKILGQKDLEILRGWLKLASASRTVEEFESRMSCGVEA